MNRYARILTSICGHTVELAIHGYKHVDYTKLSREQCNIHFKKAKDLFSHWGLDGKGYRFPYLRRDPQLINVLDQKGFFWDSSHVVLWHVLNRNQFEKGKWQGFEKILETYHADDSQAVRSLPRMKSNLVEIPVSIPDDDILIERLRIFNSSLVGEIFVNMLNKVRSKGELLVLQLHPERFQDFEKSLKMVLDSYRKMNDGWAASLGEVTAWWKEKLTYKIRIETKKQNEYLITKLAPDHVTLLVQGKNIETNSKTRKWDNNLTITDQTQFTIKSKQKPMIGVELKYSDEDLLFLKEEGYAFEKSEQSQKYTWYLKGDAKLDKKRKEKVIQQISQVEKPLLRFWRWPNEARFCLAITGDIDAVTVWDFWERLYV